MRITLDYGTTGLDLDLTGINATVLQPRFIAALPDEAAGFQAAVRAPIGTRPLRDLIAANETVAVVIPDGTRPLPSDRLLPWLFAELAHVPAKNFTIVIGTGSHRANTPEELDRMLGPAVARGYRVALAGRTAATLAETAELAKAAAKQTLAVVADVTDPAAVARIAGCPRKWRPKLRFSRAWG